MSRELSLHHATAPANAAGTSAAGDFRADTAGDGRGVAELRAFVAALLGETIRDFCYCPNDSCEAAADGSCAACGDSAIAPATTRELLPQNAACAASSCPCEGSCPDCLPQS